MKPGRFSLIAVGSFVFCAVSYIVAFQVGLAEAIWPYNWLRDVYVIKEHLADEAKSPRWFLLGGSNAMFGFQSALIEQATGAQVVNLGMHAELSLPFQIWQVERHVRRGDTIVLAEELVHYWRTQTYATGSVADMGLMAPEFFRETSLRQEWRMLAAMPPSRIAMGLIARLGRGTAAYRKNLTLVKPEVLIANLAARWKGAFHGEVPAYYNYLELDPQGDYERLRTTKAHPHDDYGLTSPDPVVPEVWIELEAFSKRMRALGVTCYYTWQPFELRPGIDYQAPAVQAHFAELRQRLAAAQWHELGPPEDCMFESSLFYDTPYHLTTEGARMRTVRLIERWRALRAAR